MRRLYEWKPMNPQVNNNNSSTATGNMAASSASSTKSFPSQEEKFKKLLAQIDKEKKFTYNIILLNDNALVFELIMDSTRKITMAIIYKPFTSPPGWKVGVNNLTPLDYKDWNEVLDVFEVPGIIKDVSSLKESLKEELSIPSKLYHATYKQFLNSIKKKGLGNTKKKMWSDSKPGVVYLADDPWVAESYAEESEYIDSVEDPDDYLDNIVILEVDVSKLDSSKLYIDSNVLLDADEENSTWEYHGIIPWEAIRVFNSSIAEEFEVYNNLWSN